MSLIKKTREALSGVPHYKVLGHVERIKGLVIESRGPKTSMGQLCSVTTQNGKRLAEVVGFDGPTTLLMALQEMDGLSPGDQVAAYGMPLTIGLSSRLMGRVINGLGQPIDNGPAIPVNEYRSLNAEAPHPLTRNRVQTALPVGVRAIDGMLTLGQGQRVGIFAGSGVGKSILLGMMAKFTAADVVVVGLIGERGREVREFIEKHLGTEGLKKTIVVSETSDRWPLLRIKGALTTTTIAEYFRDQGKRVLMLLDSITRVCHAYREVGLSLGEPPATRGYPPSVFAALPKLLERTGNSECGSITAIYTVLVEGDDMLEPVADSVRSILDGHIVLSRKLAAKNHYPAIDIMSSVSRVMPDIITADHMKSVTMLKELMSAYQDAEDLISIGAYAKGSRPMVDKAMDKLPKAERILRQHMDEPSDIDQAVQQLRDLVQAK
ncbi:FliI/YscN family ATPase [bacterium]|nr:FliI/YscN family ATPase [bacterium]MBU1637574.1 FliI/YscN family ATPase [bacterium]MBU1919910.1 FliI/YscN family ATPase [bacterium]